MSAQTLTLWVCVDCYHAYHEGDYTPTDQATPWALFDLSDGAPTITSQVTPGLMFGAEGCPHTDENRGEGDEHAEECERRTFSSRRCDGCGSDLAGEREAMTQWLPDPDELVTLRWTRSYLVREYQTYEVQVSRAQAEKWIEDPYLTEVDQYVCDHADPAEEWTVHLDERDLTGEGVVVEPPVSR